MRLVPANHSSYPRVGASPESQRLRRAYARHETGDLSAEGYLDVARSYIQEILAEQADAGLRLATDGQVHWYDAVAHPTSRLEGTRIDGLLRFFDTNSYVRRPEIVGPLRGSFGLAPDYTFASGVSSVPVKVVVAGPYTLARHSLADAETIPELTMSFAGILHGELRALAAAGADVVQVEEPSLLKFPADAGLVRRALGVAVDGKPGVRVSLVTYFGDALPVYADLLEMPVDMLGFDLTYGPSLADEIVRRPPEVPLALGAVDGRNTKLDDDTVAATVDRIARALERRGVDEIHLQPSCGLEYLPRDRARRKLERMAEIASLVTGVAA
jgi:5-methyltetrahydropteroyltriglutamate--homocysteine methyltransferase